MTLHVAGRTDAGVHALAQVAHFDLERNTNGDVIRDALNAYVRPHKVTVLEAVQVSNDFHARFSALTRHYRYQIINRRAPPALWDQYAWHVSRSLDCDLMQQAANFLLGTHDFSTFRAQNCQATSPIKTMDMMNIRRDGEWVYVETKSRSFLYHQVRNMVGTLSMVGTGKWTLNEFEDSFKACDRSKGGPTAPSHGLFFLAVTYP